MSSREFAEWVAYAGIEPFGETRADIRIATVAALLAEANRDRKQRRKAFSVGEFVALFRGGASARHSPDSLSGAQTAVLDQDALERKKAALWANFKAWAMRASPAGSRRVDGDAE
jgi:hypothetical protein